MGRKDIPFFINFKFLVTDEFILYNNQCDILVVKSENKEFYLPRPNIQNKNLTFTNDGLAIEYRIFIDSKDYYTKYFDNILHNKPFLGKIQKQDRQGTPVIEWDLIENDYTKETPLEIIESTELIDISMIRQVKNGQIHMGTPQATLKLVKGEPISINN